MKSQFARIKNRAKGASTRTLAVMLCFVMLLTAVGAGTMMTAFSAQSDSGETVVAELAQKVADIADAADTAAANVEDADAVQPGDTDVDKAADTESDDDDGFMPIITKKTRELTETGKKADLAEIAQTYTDIKKIQLHGGWTDWGRYSSTWRFDDMMMGSNYGSKDMIIRSGTAYEFKPNITYNSDWSSDYGLNSSTGFTFSGSSSYYRNLTARSDGYNFGLQTIDSPCGFVNVNVQVWGNHYDDSEIAIVQSIPDYTTIYFENNTGYSDVYLYTFNSESQGSWPGAKIISGGNVNNDDNSSRHTYTEQIGNNLYRIYVVGGGAAKFIVNDNNGHQTSDIDITEGSKYTVNSSMGVTKTAAEDLSLDFWLEGYLEGSNVSTTTATRKFTKSTTNSDEYLLDYVSGTANQYPVIFDGRNYYHPTSNEADSGTAADINKTKTSYGNNDNKWKTADVSGATIHYVWNAKTKTLSWTVDTATNYYLTGWLNNGSVTNTDSSRQFTESATSGVYTLSWSPSGDNSGYQYATIYTGSASYHPATHPGANGAEATVTKNAPGEDAKWKVGAVAGQTVNFTWDTRGTNPTLSWTVSGGSSSSSSWKDTKTHSDATPEYTGDAGSYRFVWADNDDGPGKAGTTAIVPTNNGSNGYWADLTSYVKNNSNFFFALSNNNSNSGIRGNKNEEIDDTKRSAGTTVTMTNGSGETIFYVEMKERSSVSGSAYFQLIRGVDWTKISAVGVHAYYSDSYVDYKYYYKEVGSTDEQVTSVTVYAKDGAAPINWDDKGSGGASATSGTAYNYAAIATTAISQIDGATPASGVVSTVNVGDASSQYQTATVDAGKSIQITTTIDNTSPWRTKYYVRGWCINGVTYTTDGTPGINTTVNSEGVYTMTYTIPAEPEVDYLEITPIYYISSAWASSNNVTLLTFYVEGYNTIQSKWGNTPYVYPFYGNLNNVENSFGVYPGQPMVYVEGKYSIEIPMTSTTIMAQTSTGTAIKGITVNNGYADHVHRNLIYGWTAADNDAAHKQTYDYDDFYKIYNECLTNAAGQSAGHPNSIIFRIQDEETTYNRSAYGGGKSGQFADGTDDINISAIASSGNGWELLTNRYDQAINLFGTTVTKPSSGTAPENDTSNALYVVSTGYNANIAGDYGTMWKIYNGSGELISTDTTNGRYGVPPSVLLLRGSASGYDSAVAGVGYPAASHEVNGVGSYTDNISKYETIYKALQAYTDKRVYITYEKDAQDTRDDSSGTGAYRLDGRWYYTHSTDNVQSTVGIEYWDNSTGAWVTDTVTASSGTGSSGNNVVFDSDSRKSDSERTTSSSKVINDGGTWSFTATAGTGYMFDSWQIKYSDTSYDQIVGAGASASIGATANYTLVARFVPIVTGSLTIDHTLSGSSTGEGTVDMTVLVKDGSTTKATYNGSHVYIDGTYISNSYGTYTIDVTLKTTPKYDGTVTAFGYDKFNTSNNITATTSPAALPGSENTLTTSHFTFTVSQLYADTTLATSSLAYTSTITETPHTYDFTYNFTTRDNQSKTYTSRGVISLKDYKAYVGDNHVMDTSYVTAKAPFESNFLKTTTLTPTAPTYTSGTHTFAGTYTFTNDAATPLHHVIVKLPYDYCTSNIPSGSKKYSASNTAYNASKATFDLAAYYNQFLTIGATSTVPGSQENVSKVTDATDTNHTGNDFITAPDELTNSGTTMYFAYWDIKQLKADGVTPSESVAKLYYPDFHYRIYSNYYVEAVYTATAANSWKMKYSDDENNVGANIIYLGDSRNQWNDGSASSGSSSDSATAAADRIYSDFIFNYADKGAELKGSTSVEIGMVIERVIYTEDGTRKWATGSANVTDMYSYKTTYVDTEAAMARDIKNALQNATAMPTGCIKQAWSTSDLNNKNFMEQNYNVYSAYGQTVSESGEITYKTDNTIDNYVYRAYAYIKASDGKYYLSEPAYFCMRYTANRKFS